MVMPRSSSKPSLGHLSSYQVLHTCCVANAVCYVNAALSREIILAYIQTIAVSGFSSDHSGPEKFLFHLSSCTGSSCTITSGREPSACLQEPQYLKNGLTESVLLTDQCLFFIFYSSYFFERAPLLCVDRMVVNSGNILWRGLDAQSSIKPQPHPRGSPIFCSMTNKVFHGDLVLTQ